MKKRNTYLIQNISQLIFVDSSSADLSKYRFLDIYSKDLKDYIAVIRMTDEGEIRLEIHVIYHEYRSFSFSIEVIEEIIKIAKEYKLKMLEQLG